MKSKYEDKIKVLVEAGVFEINGDRILVEALAEEEKKTASGLIIAEAKKNPLANAELAVMRVLAVGDGYYHENPKTGEAEMKPLPYKPGDTIIVSTLTAAMYKDFFLLKDYKENSIGLVSSENVHAKIGDLGKFLELLRA